MKIDDLVLEIVAANAVFRMWRTTLDKLILQSYELLVISLE